MSDEPGGGVASDKTPAVTGSGGACMVGAERDAVNERDAVESDNVPGRVASDRTPGVITPLARRRDSEDPNVSGKSNPNCESVELEPSQFNQNSDYINVNKIDNSNSSKYTSIFVNGKRIEFQVDTGSDITCMSLDTFNRLQLVGASLAQSGKGQIIVASGHTVPAQSVYSTSVLVKYRDRQCKLVLRVIDSSFPTLMGRDWMDSLFGGNWFERLTAVNAVSELSFEQVRESVIEKMRKSEIFQPGVGRVKKHLACLDLKPEAQPKFQKARPVAYAEKDEISRELDRLVEVGYYSPVDTSQWASPVVAVRKPDGAIRLCGDYKRTLNPQLDMMIYPLPIVEDCFVSMKGGQHFSKIDIKQAYNSIPLRESDQLLATINTHRGLYKPLSLPFGINSATSIFQSIMDKELLGLEFVTCRVDDILISGDTTESHVKRLYDVTGRLEQCGFKCRWDKSEFLKESVVYLGYEISRDGVRPCRSKVETLAKAPYPTKLTELVSFLGAVNYYSRFLRNQSTLIEPLNKLRTSEWSFGEKEKECFDELKAKLTSNDVLTFYDPDMPLRLDTDSSSYGLGAVISHVDSHGVDRPIEFISRTLTSAERNYAQIEKEALSIVWAVKRFHKYLYARPFHLLTDHQPLQFLFSPNKGIPEMCSSRVQRWALTLSSYNYTVEYRSTLKHCNADVCSRFPLPETDCGVEMDESAEVKSAFAVYISEDKPLLNAEVVARLCKKDQVLSRVMYHVREGWPRDWKVPENATCSKSKSRAAPGRVTPETVNVKKSDQCGKEPECTPENAVLLNEFGAFYTRRAELSIEKGCLLWGNRTVIPTTMRRDILQLLHSTHSGMCAMKSIARNYVWWPKLDRDIEVLARGCYACALNKNLPPKAKPHPWIRSSAPWERLHIDFAGPFKGNMWLIVVDSYSKWIEVVNMRSDCTAPNTIRKLQILFNRYGLCRVLVSDNGPQLISHEFDLFCKGKGINHIPIPSYHPASNGQAESIVGKFKKVMKKMCESNADLEMNLTSWLFQYHNTPHTTTKVEPAVLMTGRRFRSPLSLLNPLSFSTTAEERESSARVESEKSLRRFDAGDLVMYRDVRHGRWIKGVVRAVSDKVYDIYTEHGGSVRKHIDHVVANTTEATPEPVKLDREKVQSEPEVVRDELSRDQAVDIVPDTIDIVPNEAAYNNKVPTVVSSTRPKRTMSKPDRLEYNKLGG